MYTYVCSASAETVGCCALIQLKEHEQKVAAKYVKVGLFSFTSLLFTRVLLINMKKGG